MDFMTAMANLQTGFKVRRRSWSSDSAYLHLVGDTVYNDRMDKVRFDNIKCFDKEDYEIFYEEPKPLGDKIFYINRKAYLEVGDVKEAIAILNEDLALHFNSGKGLLHPMVVSDKILKHFGRKLV